VRVRQAGQGAEDAEELARFFRRCGVWPRVSVQGASSARRGKREEYERGIDHE